MNMEKLKSNLAIIHDIMHFWYYSMVEQTGEGKAHVKVFLLDFDCHVMQICSTGKRIVALSFHMLCSMYC